MTIQVQQSQRLARNFTWLSLQEVLIRVFGLAIAIFLTRILSPEDYGALGIAMAIVGLLGTLVQAGTGTRATRLTALEPENVPGIYGHVNSLRLMLALAAIAGLCGLAPLLAQYFSFPILLLVLCSLLLLRNALTVVWAFRGLEQMHVIAVAEVLGMALTLLGLVVFIRGGENDIYRVPLVEFAAAMIMVWWLRRRLLRSYADLALDRNPADWATHWPPIVKESLPLGAAALLGTLGQHGALLLLGLLSTASQAAQFLVAHKVMLTLAALIFVIHRAAFPATSRMMNNEEQSALKLLADLLRYILVIMIPIMLLAGLLAEDLLVLVFGDNYRAAAPVLQVLLLTLPTLAFSNNLTLLLKAVPKPGGVLAGRVAAVSVLVAAAALLIPSMGSRGAAYAVLCAGLAGLVVQWVLVRRLFGSSPINLRCFSPFLAGLGATLVYTWSGSFPQSLSIVVSLAAYLLFTLLTGAVTLREVQLLPGLIGSIIRQPLKQ